MKRYPVVIPVLTVLLAVAGCSSGSPLSSEITSASTSTSKSSDPAPSIPEPTSQKDSTCKVSCQDVPQYGGPSVLPPPTWAAEDPNKAQEAAIGVMKAYIRPGADQSNWYAEIRPRVTDTFGAILRKFNPKYQTVSQITGPATTKTDPGNPFEAVISFPTNDGVYTVTMLRTTQTSPWLANSIVPPLGKK